MPYGILVLLAADGILVLVTADGILVLVTKAVAGVVPGVVACPAAKLTIAGEMGSFACSADVRAVPSEVPCLVAFPASEIWLLCRHNCRHIWLRHGGRLRGTTRRRKRQKTVGLLPM